MIHGAAYLGGAILTMALFAGVVGRMLVRMGRIESVLRCTGMVAIAVGVVWILLAVA